MKFINLTPHDVVIVSKDGKTKTIKASGDIARVDTNEKLIDNIGGVDIYRTTYGSVNGLPSKKEGVGYIVSGVVRAALPKRKDLFSPTQLIRNNSGQVIGARGLSSNL